MLAAASEPNFASRPENERTTSRHWLRMYRSVQTRPAIARPLYQACSSGFRKRIATAAQTSATPSQPRSPRKRFNITRAVSSTAPAFAVHRLGGEEQTERDE